MQLFFKALLSPIVFAVGFIWPLLHQSFVALGWLEGTAALSVAGLIALALGLMAQFAGSWIWIK